ncbi:hypothetical protein QF025_004127 [Paraburkholderia graminis]|uniref:Uncharacterized protein n=1 Tax=Paraburkholderia graminis TaxID=60548 RepID=A0ABD5CJH3_9BURK|nr:hypothetical protein [Paraburkholderia graminis]
MHSWYVAGQRVWSQCFEWELGAVPKLGGGHIGPNAQVVAVNAETHNFCFPLKNSGGHLSYRL